MKKFFVILLTAALGLSFAADNTAVKETKPAKKTVSKSKNRPIRHGDYGMARATTPAPRFKLVGSGKKSWWQKRVEEKVELAKKSGKDVQILQLGDSITHRWERDRENYEVYKEYFSKYNILNLGCGGDSTSETLWIIKNSGVFNYISPKMIILLIGTNNTGACVTGEVATAAGVKCCVDALRQAAPDSKILLFAIFPRGKNTSDIKYRKNEMVNESIKSLADNKYVFFANINDKFLDEKGNLRQNLMPDYLHPSPAGYHIWGKAITPYIKRFVDGK